MKISLTDITTDAWNSGTSVHSFVLLVVLFEQFFLKMQSSIDR